MDKLAKDEKTGEYFTVYTEKPIMLISDDKKKWFVQTSPRELELETKLLEMESKLKQANEWISVEDRLPYDIFDWVLVFADGAMSTLGYTKDNGFYEVHPIKTQVNINKITHWKPLPKPPTGE